MCSVLFQNQAFGRVIILKEPPRELEEKYSDAVLKYYNRDYSSALNLTNEILKQSENQKTLELKGLIQKSLSDFSEAKKTYAYIIQKVSEAGLKPTEALGAYFDLAVVEYKLNNLDQSLRYLNFCIANNFNTGASYFFRGLINEQKDNLPVAQGDFTQVMQSNAEALKAWAALYLSSIHSRQQNYDESIYYLGQAKKYSEKTPETLLPISDEILQNRNELAKRIQENIEILNSAQYFKSAALILSYDSNVLSVPAAGTVSDVFSGKSAEKLTIKGLIGHASGYFEPVQHVWSYQFSGLIVDKREVETGQFLTNDFIYLWNIDPSDDISQSYRTGLNANFQYQVNPTSQKGAFGPYSISGMFGYSRKVRESEKVANVFDFSFKYESFLQDPAFSDFMKKTGLEAAVSYLRSWDSKKFIFNPGAGFTLKRRQSQGVEFRNWAGQFTLLNQFYFSQKNIGTLTATLSYHDYSERQGQKRADTITAAQWDQSYKINAELSALLSLNYTMNSSNITDVYKYDRYVVSTGATYSF